MESEKYKMSALEGIVVAIQSVIERIVTVFGTLFTWIFKLRKIFMALPVLYAAMELAKRNLEELPEVVGFDIQSTGEFAQMVSVPEKQPA